MSSKNVLVYIRVVYTYGMKFWVKMIVPGKELSSHSLEFVWVLFYNPNRVTIKKDLKTGCAYTDMTKLVNVF